MSRYFFHGQMTRNGDLYPTGGVAPTGRFGRMFPSLPPLAVETGKLDALGAVMVEASPSDAPSNNADVPAGYTYLGQFIDHDVTFDTTSLQETQMDPMAVLNFRTPALDLDSLYGRGPAAQPELYQRGDSELFEIGRTSAQAPQGDPTVPPSLPFDLPRGPNGFALIGDPRNDENLVVAQLHLALLRFHNKVVAGLRDGSIPREAPLRKTIFEEARDLVIWHYQWIVLHDFLALLLDAGQLKHVLENGSSVYDCGTYRRSEPFMPVEFAGAAYRFGHSMIRAVYDHNRVFTFRPGGVVPASLELLFRFSGKSGDGSTVPIPSDWIIDWRRFFELDPNVPAQRSRKLDAFLAVPLTNLPNVPEPKSLAVRNLRRGNLMALPPAQSIARLLQLPELTAAELTSGPDGKELGALGLVEETPLFFYVLKEAEQKGQGKRLGPLGSRIVAETFVGLLDCDESSFRTRNPDWKPTLPGAKAGHFTIADLIAFAGDTNPIGDASA